MPKRADTAVKSHKTCEKNKHTLSAIRGNWATLLNLLLQKLIRTIHFQNYKK